MLQTTEFVWTRPIVAVIALACTTTALPAQTRAPSVDVAGRWSLVIRSSEGAQSRTLDLTVLQDTIVTGSVGSPLGSVTISSGKIVGDQLRLDFEMAGGEVRVSYDLVVERDTLRGVFRQGDFEGAVLGVRGEGPVRFPAEGSLGDDGRLTQELGGGVIAREEALER